MDAVVLGNATLDIICQTVNEVPRFDSISFENVAVAPGGCGSNVAIGLCALGVSTALIARVGRDAPYDMITSTWRKVGLDDRFVKAIQGKNTGVSVGLVDDEAQPRFIHTTGANALLTAEAIDVQALLELGMRYLHVAGYFVLPGLLNSGFSDTLGHIHRRGVHTSLDVVRSPRMDNPEPLWKCMPHLDIFLCNAYEGKRISGESSPLEAARNFRSRGAKACIVKLGKDGCWLESEDFSGLIQGESAVSVDTTGAGDAFAAGLLAGRLRGEDLPGACRSGNQAGRRIVGKLGAIAGWF